MKIAITGNIGSGKSYVARNFGYPVFNADYEVAQLYQRDKKIFTKLKKSLPPDELLSLKIPSKTFPFSPSIKGSIIQNSIYWTLVLSKSVSFDILLVIAPKLEDGFLSRPDEVRSGL